MKAAPRGAPKITMGMLTHHIDHTIGEGPSSPILIIKPKRELMAIIIMEVKVTFFGFNLKYNTRKEKENKSSPVPVKVEIWLPIRPTINRVRKFFLVNENLCLSS